MADVYSLMRSEWPPEISTYAIGMADIGDKPRPARQFPLTATSLCNCGSESKGVPELSALAKQEK